MPFDKTFTPSKTIGKFCISYGITSMQLASILYRSYDKVKLLEEAGATLVRTRKHQVLVLRNGKKVVLPKTPSDHRSSLNAIGDLRRAMRGPART